MQIHKFSIVNSAKNMRHYNKLQIWNFRMGNA